jgi:hypothetical protein
MVSCIFFPIHDNDFSLFWQMQELLPYHLNEPPVTIATLLFEFSFHN